MATYQGTISRKWLIKQLVIAYMEARKRKLKTEDECSFEIYWYEDIELLADDILNGTYKPSPGVAFIVEEPVTREIFAAPFRDRVVHHFLFNMSAEWWDRRLIYNSSSCRKGKGTMFGWKRLQKDIRQVSKGYSKEAYVVKLDIQGYFMSLPREGLYNQVVWGLKRQFGDDPAMLRLLKFLWREVIFDDPTKGVKIRPPIARWKKLPRTKSLFYQPEGQGIVIGNLSSQLLSNIYLDKLDRFIKLELKYKHYGRYVDDFYMVVPAEEKAQAERDIQAISKFLVGLGLTLHPKKRYIQEVHKGVAFLGVVIYPHGVYPGKRFKRNFYKAAEEVMMGLRSIHSLESYIGWLTHINGDSLCRKVFEHVGWDYPF